MLKSQFNPDEFNAIKGISIVIALRMLGLAIVIPLFSLHAASLPNSYPLAAGVAFSIYALTQALLQIPFGFLSDRIGRKKVIVGGLILFIIGSIICAVTDDIYILAVGRFIQGSGAIASTALAWVADITSEKRRAIGMAIVGMGIGLGFTLGIIIAPIIASFAGIRLLFLLSALLALAAIVYTLRLKETVQLVNNENEKFSLNIVKIVSSAVNPLIAKVCFIGFIANLAMMATFFIMPLRLQDSVGIGMLWQIYLPVALAGLMSMVIGARVADRGHYKLVIISGLGFILLADLILLPLNSLLGDILSLGLLFIGFTALESVLPALISKLSPPDKRGSVIGLYSLSMFIGAFSGGIVAGATSANLPLLFAGITIMSFIGIIFAISINKSSLQIKPKVTL
ncbi:MAG: MFS transporter [Nitrospinota bacterium]